jgi:uncharacterized protein (TIGR03086 family)
MSDAAERYRRAAARFTQRASEVEPEAWEAPAPCEGWVARDIVGHMVEWMPAFLLAAGGPSLPAGPSVDDDPVGAWTTMSDGIQGLLDDPATAALPLHHPQAGSHALADAVSMFVLGDIVIHTWDLARAAGLDETLDPDEVSAMLAGLQPMDEILRSSGHYGPKVAVLPDADEQTQLIAFTGRQP